MAALCSIEVLKVASNFSLGLNNWLNFNNAHGCYTFSYEQERNPDCPVCSRKVKKMSLKSGSLLKDVLEYLKEDTALEMTDPSVILSLGGDDVKTLWMPNVEAIQKHCRDNLTKRIDELGVANGRVLEVQDRSSPLGMTFQIEITD